MSSTLTSEVLEDARPLVSATPRIADRRSASIKRRLARPRRVLFVSYPFPPVGGAGVQRVTKFVKYLPEFGWCSSVLTVANPSVPAYDPSLLADIPASTIVRKARTWEPSYAWKSMVSAGSTSSTQRGSGVGQLLRGGVRRLLNLMLQPDVQVLWLPGAVHTGKQLLREVPHDAIVASGPPFSTFLIGALLSRQAGLPLVLDYRDEWGLSNAYWENRRLGPVTRFLQTQMQYHLMRSAEALIATTRASATALAEGRSLAGSRAAVSWIYNGYDPDDFAGERQQRRRGKTYQLAYVGTLWNLTTVEPLVRAVAHLTEHRPDLAAHLELLFAGRRTAPQQQLVDQLKRLPCRVVEHPYTDHAQAIRWLCQADGLCLLLADVPGASRVVPAKLFEYLAARRPLLAIAPPGETWDLLQDCPLAHRFAPSDTVGIARWLEHAIQGEGAVEGGVCDSWRNPGYDRRHQAGQLAALLDELQASSELGRTGSVAKGLLSGARN